MGLLSNLKHTLAVKRVYARFQEEAHLGRLKTAAFALVGMALTAGVAKITEACPDLMNSGGAILTACVSGGIAYWMKRPKDTPVGSTLLVALVTAIAAGGIDAIRNVCGTEFMTQLPTVLTAVGWSTVGLWLAHPREV